MKRIILAQFIVLFVGTLFAWFNFATELISWLNQKTCATSCVPGINNPFLTPCFYEAIFFTIAFILSAIIFKKTQE